MTTPLPVGPLTPYLSPQMLIQAPTGVDFFSIPPDTVLAGGTPQGNMAEIANICQRATALADECVHQPLRATIDTLPLYGPGARVGVDRSCRRPTELILKRWPVLAVTSVQVAPNCLPWNFCAVPASEIQIKHPVTGLYGSSAPPATGEGGQSVLISPQWVRWDRGHEGYVIMTEYANGWPHAGLTADAVPVTGDAPQTVAVDDCTGWVITSPFTGQPAGATGTLYDAGNQEVIQVTAASASQGPGTLTLSAPLRYPHAAGTITSCLPQSAIWASMLFAIEQALERGATAIAIMEIPGQEIAQGAGVDTTYGSPAKWAEKILAPFARIV